MKGSPLKPRDNSAEELERFRIDVENAGMVDKYIDILKQHPKYSIKESMEVKKTEEVKKINKIEKDESTNKKVKNKTKNVTVEKDN